MDHSSKMMKMEYKTQQKINHLLSANQAADLFAFVEVRVQEGGCNHTCRFIQEWLDANVDFMQHEAILTELENMGGYCDCEMLKNCYEDYEL